MKFAILAVSMAAVQGVALKFDHETEVALSQQKSKWFEDDIHDDEYSPNDIDDMVRDKTHVQIADNMQTRLSELVSGMDEDFENVDIQLQDNINNHKMASIAQKYGVY